MKKTARYIWIGLCSAFLVVAIAAISLFGNELKSLLSINKLDDYGMLQMRYYGDYGFDDFLKIGAESDADIEAFVTKRLLKGLPIDLNVAGDGCTAFAVQSEAGDILFGRNFDFSYAPSMQVYTRPKNGYASVSTVNLSFAGYSQDKLPSGVNPKSFLALAAPYLPFDGMNEKGVAIALLAVPETHLEKDVDKLTLNTTTAIRLVLDKAATVEEAVALLRQYNIYFSGGIDCHYLIADASGKFVLAEFWDGQLQAVTTDAEYQIATNFIAYNGLNIGEGYDEFDRYDKVKAAIEENNGTLTQEQAIKTLTEVGVYGENGEDKLQWSVLYNLTDLSGVLFAHRNNQNQTDFQLR